MTIPIDVTFQEMWPSEEIMDKIGEHAEALGTSVIEILGCYVMIGRRRSRKGKGRRFKVNVSVTSRDLGSMKESTDSSTGEHDHIDKALNRAFRGMGSRFDSRSPKRITSSAFAA